MSKKEKVLAVLKSSTFWGVVLFFALVAVDQIIKIVADAYFNSPGAPKSVTIIPNLINLTLSYNRGIAFGWLSEVSPELEGVMPAIKIAVIVGTAVLMAGIGVLFFFIDKRRTVVRISLVLIFSGGVGNLIDRLMYRIWETNGAYGVRDMVDLSAFGLAICNFADFFIVIGAIVLIVAFLFFDRDAFFPVGKFKALAEEQEEKERAKKEGIDSLATEDEEQGPVDEDNSAPCAETLDEEPKL